MLLASTTKNCDASNGFSFPLAFAICLSCHMEVTLVVNGFNVHLELKFKYIYELATSKILTKKTLGTILLN